MNAPAIAEGLRAVRSRIDAAAARAGRSAESVRLVAACKAQPADAVRAAYLAGQREFGENYAQELSAKAEALRDLGELRWHFIGQLQVNKARHVVGVAHVVQTVDRESLLRELDRRAAAAGVKLEVLVEVNLADEQEKGGCAPADVPRLLDAIARCPALVARGLMAIPPFDSDPERARPYFAMLRELLERHGGGLRELSMGMSNDYEVAVSEGATMVRVGSAIFGVRPSRGQK